MELARPATGTAVPASLPLRPSDRPPIAALDACPGGLAPRVADAMPGRHPATVFATTAVAGWLLLEAVMLALGLLLVDVVLHAGTFDRTDERLSRWFFEQRTPTLNDLSYAGSKIGDIPVLPGLVVLAVLLLLIGRRYRAAAFIATAGVVELATYRVTSMVIHRERPLVPRLDDLPANQSFPSGHVAASVAVYGALAVVLSSRFRQRWVAITAWTLVVALPTVVALSRMYRGMHHLSDVVAGALVGTAALLIALLAARAGGVVVARRQAAATTEVAR